MLRVIARRTQDELAQALGYLGGRTASSHVSRFESGVRRLPEEKREIAARYLAASGFLVGEWEYLLAYLDLEHADLRGCIAARPTLTRARDNHEAPITSLMPLDTKKAPAEAGASRTTARSPSGSEDQMSYLIGVRVLADCAYINAAFIPCRSRSRQLLPGRVRCRDRVTS